MAETQADTRARIDIIDAVRGLSILLMVIYHLGYDLVYAEIIPKFIVFNPLIDALQLFFAALFIFISGVSSRLSRSNLKRGFIMLAFAVAISAVTYLFESPVWFGILHFLGVAAVLYGLLGKLLQRVTSAVYPAVCALMFVVSYVLTSGIYDIEGLWMFGIRDKYFTSADYFPVFPWIFVYFAGAWFGRYVIEKSLPNWFYELKCGFFAGVGRKTLFVYLLHQPVIYGVLWIVIWIKGAIAA